jgi:hypothetical protein
MATTKQDNFSQGLAQFYRMRQNMRHNSFPIETPTKIHGALDRMTDERPITKLFCHH